MAFSCSMCSFCATNNATLVSHVCKIHRYDPNFLIYCSRCVRSFKVWDTYKKHLYRGCGENPTNSASEDDVEDVNEGDHTMDISSEYLELGSNDSSEFNQKSE